MGYGVEQAEEGYELSLKIARNAVWAPDPLVQVAVNLVILVAAMLSSSVGFAPGIIIALFAITFGTIGVIRALYAHIMG